MGYGVIRQVLTDDWAVAKEFLKSLTHKEKAGLDRPFQCVIKPCRGSASLGVFLATSMNEAESIFRGSVGTCGNG